MDFVTFDLAYKLKEKGIRELCVAHYDDCLTLNCDSPLTEGRCFHSFNAQDKYKSIADAPTIEQASKWLREEKGISLNIYPSYFANLLYWTCDVISFIGEISIEKRLGGDVKTYEEAAIYGIEYVIDNLI